MCARNLIHLAVSLSTPGHRYAIKSFFPFVNFSFSSLIGEPQPTKKNFFLPALACQQGPDPRLQRDGCRVVSSSSGTLESSSFYVTTGTDSSDGSFGATVSCASSSEAFSCRTAVSGLRLVLNASSCA